MKPANFLQSDLLFLSQLPLEKLLQVRKSLNDLKYESSSYPTEEPAQMRMESRMDDENVDRTHPVFKNNQMALVEHKNLLNK